jgi:para-aminobenzoate synthetase component 1
MRTRELHLPGEPLDWLARASDRAHPVLLRLPVGAGANGRRWILVAWGPAECATAADGDLLERLAHWAAERAVPAQADLPFAGGALGHFEYAARVPGYPPEGPLALTGWWGWYDRFLLYDEDRGTTLAAVRGDAEALHSWREEVEAVVHRTIPMEPAEFPLAGEAVTPPSSDLGRADYEAGVRRAQEWIAAGDIYQVNLAQRFRGEHRGSATDLFRRLWAANPAPAAAYLDTGPRQVLSSSPEWFLSGRLGGLVETRPIKGTRPRSADPARDHQLARELQDNRKEQAELLMIVDMERNDLGRVCRPGTVRADRPFAIESFASVHHLVGRVRGELRPEVGWPELFAATYPGGSITGAPKLRAMDILAALEPSPRRAFCGTIGCLSADGQFHTNIAIRTLEKEGDFLSFGVGAGIVADSDPAAEYEETLNKAERLLAAAGWEASPPALPRDRRAAG